MWIVSNKEKLPLKIFKQRSHMLDLYFGPVTMLYMEFGLERKEGSRQMC